MDVFSNATINEEATSVATEVDAKKKRAAEKKEKLKAAMTETLNNDPTYMDRHHTLSNSLEVVNSLGYTKAPNIVKDKSATGERKLVNSCKNVGYMIKNVGKEALAYTTEVFTKNEAGVFVGTMVEKTLAPGEVVPISRKYLTRLCAIPEYSFTLANGKLIASSANKLVTLDDHLESYYFRFDADADGNIKEINDDEVKLTIDVDGVIKPEYEETFGYLNNPVEKKAKVSAKKNGLTVQDFSANYINSLIQKSMQ